MPLAHSSLRTCPTCGKQKRYAVRFQECKPCRSDRLIAAVGGTPTPKKTPPATEKQLAFLEHLGYAGAPPVDIAEASKLIESMKAQKTQKTQAPPRELFPARLKEQHKETFGVGLILLTKDKLDGSYFWYSLDGRPRDDMEFTYRHNVTLEEARAYFAWLVEHGYALMLDHEAFIEEARATRFLPR
jgi:hypothetical protein